uniref:Uncharacterized protein n=1 Tax=Pithovirus LCPAC102 TaxID=2506587 RepID=A0A4D5XF72_9VIRU|nr:MAG: uncharacterized protein LCPAC102_01550 [Pithovirus LCPAC102]
MNKPIFIWNGTYLGEFFKTNILYETYYIQTKTKYWTINYLSNTLICAIKKVDSVMPCIYDELMPIFNLPKIGTHYIKYKNNIYILYKILYDTNYSIMPEILLSSIDINKFDEFYRSKIRHIYIIRDLIGITHTNDNDIIVRQSYNKNMVLNIISFKTYGINESISINSTITNTCKKKWFTKNKEEINIRHIYREIFKDVNNIDDIPIYISDIIIKMSNIIKRINPEYCYITNIISDKIMNKLSLMID